MKNSIKNNSGFILLLVLGILSSLALLVLALVQESGSETILSQSYANKTRSRLLARSGLEEALSVLEASPSSASSSALVTGVLGDGTYSRDGDTYHYTVTDTSGQININDGIAAGDLELGGAYNASALDPWPTSDEEQPDKSGLINLRLRRLLNAYGDVFLLMHDNYLATGQEMLQVSQYGTAYTRSLTSTAVGDHGTSMPGGRGLGDVVIASRPSGGYASLEDIKGVLNGWGVVHNVQSSYLLFLGNHQSVHEAISKDLTVKSFEETNFKRFTKQAWMYGRTYGEQVNGDESNTDGYYQNDFSDGRFNPNYIDRHPYDLSNDIWAEHSVPLINLNSASHKVRAAVFFAPVNVAYLCEGAVTHTHVQEDRLYTNYAMGYLPNTFHFIDSGMARTSVGVRGPCFRPRRMVENGSDAAGVMQKNRFMTLRDAFVLSDHLERYDRNNDGTHDRVENFDDFKKFLTWHREEIVQGNQTAPEDPLETDFGIAAYAGFPLVYERSEPIATHQPLNDDTYFADHTQVVFSRMGSVQNPHLVDAKDLTKDVEVLWVSQYWKSSHANDGTPGQWHGGWFLDDYVERTLPHVFSCVRRIPGFLGAPQALTSPYMITEPFAYETDLYNSGRLAFFGRDNVELAKYQSNVENWQEATQLDGTDPALWQLGRQPKVSVEDLVERHMHPKVCFNPTGIFEIRSTGKVISGELQEASTSVIAAHIKVFERKSYRTQKDFESLRDNSSSNEIVVGPEFNGDASEDWLSCGLKDADGGGVRPNSALQDLSLYDVYLTCQPGSAVLDHDPAVTQSSQVLMDAPTYSAQSGDMFATAQSNMQQMDMEPNGSWAATDGYDGDPFGQGIFFDQNGHGEWSNDVFKNSLYWCLNRKLKSWDETSPAAANFYGNYPTGLGFHRGFAAAWFRVPTAYPFAQPVFYMGPKCGATGNNNTVLKTKTQLKRTIMSLNLHEKIEVLDSFNFTVPNQQFAEMSKPISVNVGYYSGFNGYFNRHGTQTAIDTLTAYSTSEYLFEHGVYGTMVTGIRHWPHSETRPPSAALTPYPFNRCVEDFEPAPLPLDPMRSYHGLTWSYGSMDLIHHTYYDPVTIQMLDTGAFEHYQYNTQYLTWASPSGSFVSSFIRDWNYLNYGSYIDWAGFVQVYDATSTSVQHKLPMNKSPECSSGTWHRIYAFWFLRNNTCLGDGEWTHFVSDAYGSLPGDDRVWNGVGATSRYYPVEAADAVSGNGCGAVNALNQFGIWFRDDSNFADACSSSVGNVPTHEHIHQAMGSQLFSQIVKPQFEFMPQVHANGGNIPNGLLNTTHCYPFEWLPEDPNMYLSVGDMPVNRVQHYEPMSGEGVTNPNGNTGSEATADTFHYPAYRMDSTLDDIVFAYGPNISVPGAGTYFHGLFHAANWLENEPKDEVRYEPNGQVLRLNTGDDIPAGSTLISTSSRIYFPLDTQYNYADIEFEYWPDNTSAASPTYVSENFQDIYVSTASQTTHQSHVVFKYVNNTPRINLAGVVFGQDAIINQSTIRNYNSLSALDYSFDGGDSFTNIPYIQEVTVVWRDANGVKILDWMEE